MTPVAIDAHVHIWDRTRGETFIAETAFPVLTGKAFLPRDLAPVLSQTGAESAVLVHGPATVAHALFCLDLCRAHDLFRSVVGWVDLRAPDCLGQLAQLASDPAFRGVRFTPMLDDDPDGYLRSDAAVQVARALQEQGRLVEVLAPPALFGAVEALADAVPELTVVLAHFGLPDADPAQFDAWHAAMARLARRHNIYVKVSGLPLSGDPALDAALSQRHVAAMLDLFGSDRLMYASNWPVATALASPRHWREMLYRALAASNAGAADLAAIYRDTAARLY